MVFSADDLDLARRILTFFYAMAPLASAADHAANGFSLQSIAAKVVHVLPDDFFKQRSFQYLGLPEEIHLLILENTTLITLYGLAWASVTLLGDLRLFKRQSLGFTAHSVA